MRLVRSAAITIVIVMFGAGAGRHAWRAYAENRAVAELQPAPRSAPNVILLILDTVRAMSLSSYGYARATSPHLDALATEGVRFERAVATASYTLPTHATLFTGRYPHQTSVGWGGPLDDDAPTIAEVLRRHGYATGGFAANLLYCTRAFGLARGFDTYRDYVTTPGEALRGSALTEALLESLLGRILPDYIPGRPTATQVSDRFLRWQERVSRSGRPFFAFLNFFDAHGPYVVPAPFDTMFTGRRPALRDPHVHGKKYSAQEAATLQDAYDQAIRYLDANLARLFDELERRGVLDNTIVIVTADHGEEFLEHGLIGHGDGLNFPSLHVPLIIRFPHSIPRGTVIPTPVTLRDVPATILDLIAAPEPYEIPGSTLAVHWQDRAGETSLPGSTILSELDGLPAPPDERPVTRGDMYSVVANGLHLIRQGDGHEELYDIIGDPFERFDLLARKDAGNDPRLAQVRSALAPFLHALEQR
jgi:arylsulfatase A-like enzyme